MRSELLIFLILAFDVCFAFKPNHQVCQPTKSIFTNKKCSETITPARYVIGTNNVYDDGIICEDTIGLAQYFPDECPANVWDGVRPYSYKTCEASSVLGPFSEDVKNSYNYLLEKNKKALDEVRAKYAKDFTTCPINYFKEKTVVPVSCITTVPENVEVFDTICESKISDIVTDPVNVSDDTSESIESDTEEVAEAPVESVCPADNLEEKEKDIEENKEEITEEVLPEMEEEEEIKPIEKNTPSMCDAFEQKFRGSGEFSIQESSESDDLTPLLETLLICEDILQEYDCSVLFDNVEEDNEDETEPDKEDVEEQPVVKEICEPATLIPCRGFSISKPKNILSVKCEKPKPKLDKSLLEKLKKSKYYACSSKNV